LHSVHIDRYSSAAAGIAMCEPMVVRPQISVGAS
jgi:hypothetical protein